MIQLADDLFDVTFRQHKQVDMLVYHNMPEQPVMLIFKPEMTMYKVTADQLIDIIRKILKGKKK